MGSRCAALVKMSSLEDSKAAREKLDGVIPEGTGFEMERNLMITFQVKNGVQVCDHLFVRGIPSAVQKHQIASLFNRFGQVLWSTILPPRIGEDDRCALVQMASSDEAQNAIQALNWTSSSALMPAMMVRYAGPKVFVALQRTEGIHEEGEEGSEEDEDFAHYGVIEEAPKPAFQPLKERPHDLGSRWKKAEEEEWDGPEGTRLWGWAMQPVKEQEEFPELPSETQVHAEDLTESREVESWEELGETEPCEVLCMRNPPSGLPDSVMQMWFKPYGHVVDMRPMDMEADDDSLAFIVQMSCKEEAINAFDALNGKSIMRGRPLNLSYWHGAAEKTGALDRGRLLAAARQLAFQKKEAFVAAESEAVKEELEANISHVLCLRDPPDFPESVMRVWFAPYGQMVEMRRLEDADTSRAFLVKMSNEDEAAAAFHALNSKCITGKKLDISYWHGEGRGDPVHQRPPEVMPEKANGHVPGPGVGIDNQQLLEACKVALQARSRRLQSGDDQVAPKGDVESWEDLDEEDVDDGPTDSLCVSGVPPGIQEMVMQFWFKPYGRVQELRPLSSAEVSDGKPAFLVRMGDVKEATAAMSKLDGKPIMKGSPLVVRYWHGR